MTAAVYENSGSLAQWISTTVEIPNNADQVHNFIEIARENGRLDSSTENILARHVLSTASLTVAVTIAFFDSIVTIIKGLANVGASFFQLEFEEGLDGLMDAGIKTFAYWKFIAFSPLIIPINLINPEFAELLPRRVEEVDYIPNASQIISDNQVQMSMIQEERDQIEASFTAAQENYNVLETVLREATRTNHTLLQELESLTASQCLRPTFIEERLRRDEYIEGLEGERDQARSNYEMAQARLREVEFNLVQFEVANRELRGEKDVLTAEKDQLLREKAPVIDDDFVILVQFEVANRELRGEKDVLTAEKDQLLREKAPVIDDDFVIVEDYTTPQVNPMGELREECGRLRADNVSLRESLARTERYPQECKRLREESARFRATIEAYHTLEYELSKKKGT